MALPTSEIKPRSGMKGKAVHIIHVYEDYLWSMGDKSGPPELQDISDDEYEEDEDIQDTPSETKPEVESTTEHVETITEQPSTQKLSMNGMHEKMTDVRKLIHS
jgi:translation initiation factor 2D